MRGSFAAKAITHAWCRSNYMTAISASVLALMWGLFF